MVLVRGKRGDASLDFNEAPTKRTDGWSYYTHIFREEFCNFGQLFPSSRALTSPLSPLPAHQPSHTPSAAPARRGTEGGGGGQRACAREEGGLRVPVARSRLQCGGGSLPQRCGDLLRPCLAPALPRVHSRHTPSGAAWPPGTPTAGRQ